MARFSKVFQLLAAVLVIAVVNVYVMAAPVRSDSNSKETDAPKTTETKAEVTATETATAKPAVAAEKLPLAPNSKIDFKRIFSKSEIKSRAAADNNFLKANATGKNVFKAPPRTGAPQNPSDDDDDSDRRGTWIAVGVIAAVVTLAVIFLRKDRSDGMGSAF